MARRARSRTERVAIPREEALKLWVRSGGRCAICNKYLLGDEYTTYPVKQAEMAHNVGAVDSPRSPRSPSDLTPEERSLAENLLLLCLACHNVVDAKVAQADFTLEDLEQIKRRHEDRIQYLTGLGEDSETVVLRVVGEVRGRAVELSESEVRTATRRQSARFPRYGLGYRGAGIEVDLRRIPDNDFPRYVETSRDQIRDALERVRDGVGRGEIRHLSVFGFARIPVLVLLGYELDDKIPTELYQRQREGDEAWGWDDEAEAIAFKAERLREGPKEGRAALIVALSGAPALADLPAELDDVNVWKIGPVDATPHPNVFRSRVSLDNFERTYRGLLGELEIEDVRELSLFPAVPITAAITLGRALMRGVHPTAYVYERNDDGEFEQALELK